MLSLLIPSTALVLPQRSLTTSCVTHRASTVMMPPPLNPTTAGFPLSPAGKAIVVELYLDLICPFSSKMYKVVYDEVLREFGDQVSFVLHQVPQPWHPQGTYVHELALAVQQVEPQLYPAVCRQLYAAYDAGKFTDEDTWYKSRAGVYEEILDVAASAGAERSLYPALLTNTGSGTPMTQALKWAVKYHRARSVHVRPRVGQGSVRHTRPPGHHHQWHWNQAPSAGSSLGQPQPISRRMLGPAGRRTTLLFPHRSRPRSSSTGLRPASSRAAGLRTSGRPSSLRWALTTGRDRSSLKPSWKAFLLLFALGLHGG